MALEKANAEVQEQLNPAVVVQEKFAQEEAMPAPPAVSRLERKSSECMMHSPSYSIEDGGFIRKVAESIMAECPPTDEAELSVFDDDEEAPTYCLANLTEFLEAEGGDWLTLECSIIAILFLVRFLRCGGIGLHRQTWRSVASTALLLAATVDGSNCEAPASFSFSTDIQRTKNWARAFLSQIDFNLKVSGSQYALYYFSLQGSAVCLDSPTCVSGVRQVSFRGWGGTRTSASDTLGMLGEYEIPAELVR